MGRHRKLGPTRTRKARKAIVEYVVERIVGQRILDGATEYQVKWAGWPESENTWESESTLHDAIHLIVAFHVEHGSERRKENTSQDFSGPNSTSSKEEQRDQLTTDIASKGNKRKNDLENKIEFSDNVERQQNQVEEQSSAAEDFDKLEEGVVTPKRKRSSSSCPAPDESNDHTSKNGFASGDNLHSETELPTSDLQALTIIGIDSLNGQVIFYIKFANNEVRTVPSDMANVKWPQLVIKFYQRNINWKTKPAETDSD